MVRNQESTECCARVLGEVVVHDGHGRWRCDVATRPPHTPQFNPTYPRIIVSQQLHRPFPQPPTDIYTSSRKMSDPVCCPPAAPRPKVAHPVSEKENYEATGSYEKLGDFDKVYVVSRSRSRISHGLRHADAIHDSCTCPNTFYAASLSNCLPASLAPRSPDRTRQGGPRDRRHLRHLWLLVSTTAG